MFYIGKTIEIINYKIIYYQMSRKVSQRNRRQSSNGSTKFSRKSKSKEAHIWNALNMN